MRTTQLPQAFALRNTVLRRRSFAASLLLLTALGVVPVALAAPQATEVSAPQASAAASHKPAAHARKHAAAKPAAQAAQPSASPAQAVPEATKPPAWPVNDKPTPASIHWNAAGLRIEAANSSLQQILKEVSTLTGATVEGLGSDQRVYGNFGPAPARDVLSKLLDGSGYNVLLVGDQGSGTPRQIILTGLDGKTAPKAATKSNSEENDEDVDTDDRQQQPQPQPPSVRNDFGQPRTPQQVMQEMQQRQQNGPQ
jgi:hypothetical protein